MFSLTETVTDFDAGRNALLRRRYGMIVTRGGRLVAIHLRPWPKLLSMPELWPTGPRYHGAGETDCCRLYYNQPLSSPGYLALKYLVSTPGTSYATLRAALTVLDAVAELKQSDAIVCDAANFRISDRMLARFGWEPLAPRRWHRNYIRRFYGSYPAIALPV